MNRLVFKSVLVIMTIFMTTGVASAYIYFNDFQGVVGSEWSNNTTDTTLAGSRRFLGQFTNDTVSFSLSGLPAHTQASVLCQLFILFSWDGNLVGVNVGPDEWDLSVNGGPTLLHTTFTNLDDRPQAYPDGFPGGDYSGKTGASEVNTLGWPGHGDAVYTLNYTFPHSGNSLVLNFSSTC
jgi:hypothetical protein